MSFSSEVSKYLSERGLDDSLSSEEKRTFFQKVIASLPVSLDPLSCFDEHVPNVDIDVWNGNSQRMKAEAEALLSDERLLLYVLASPKSFLLPLEKRKLLEVIFDPDFFFSYAVFSLDGKDFLLEDHSGLMVGSGRFESLIDSLR